MSAELIKQDVEDLVSLKQKASDASLMLALEVLNFDLREYFEGTLNTQNKMRFHNETLTINITNRNNIT